MARYRTTKGKKKPDKPRGGLFGCILLVVLLIAFVSWALYGVLNQD